MIADPWSFYPLAIIATLIIAISKGGFAGGNAIVGVPIMALVIDPVMAAGIILPLLVFMDVIAVRAYWRRWDMAQSKILLLGAIPGTALGIAFWRIANPDALRFLIGALAIGFVVMPVIPSLNRADKARRGSGKAAGVLAGTAVAFTSFVSHAGGPVTAVYLLSQGLSKTAYQSTTVLVFAVLNVIKAIAYGFLGAITSDTLLGGIYLVPAALVGAWLGVVAHRAIPERAFFVVTYVLLLAAGAKLIFDAVT